MVSKSQARRKQDIKSKLMAAIAMLLVSSIMMVSSTYAWFTLSTAPEVTGINTAVGANGNLEMALLPDDADLTDVENSFGVTSDVGDSLDPLKERNTTWGNLVDLGDAAYGFEHITLLPAALNLTDGKLVGTILKTPTYGSDGRVAELLANTSTGIYDEEDGFLPSGDDEQYGVRAVGTASGMTDRQLSYRNAKTNASAAASKAANLASASLNNNGSALASIAIKKGTEQDPRFNAADIAALQSIITDFTKEGGIIDQIETAYMQYILAYAASGANINGDLAWSAVKNLVEAENADVLSVIAGLTNMSIGSGDTASTVTITLPEAFTTAVGKFNNNDAENNSIVEKVAAAQTALTNLGTMPAEGYDWNAINPILSALANPDAMLINGIEPKDIKTTESINQLIADMGAGRGITVTMSSGGGVYADVADQSGNYSASVNIEKIEYSGLSVGPVAAKMTTQSTAAYLAAIGTVVDGAGAPASAGEGETPITDMFGYIIDLAFRTNAAESKLKLQAEGIDRIYSDNETGAEVTRGEGEDAVTETTMGGGSYMEFTSTTTSFGREGVLGLMEAIRIVFFDPQDGTIIKLAKLDTSTSAIESTADGGFKAPIVLYTESTAESVSYVAIGAEETVAEADRYEEYDKETFVEIGANENVDKTNRFDQDGTQNNEGTYKKVVEKDYRQANNGTFKKVTVPAGEHIIDASNEIMSLVQNTAHRLSVLVYLDGAHITNADVAATNGKSVTGTMNLQFASSATLTPMEYTPLMEQTGEDTTE